ncbi:MAG: biosynthetic peptidoglycan transglycosylase [Pseudomonadota bacterium]
MTLVFRFAPPISTLMARDLVMLRGYEREWISLERVSPVLVDTIIASEDQGFCAHNGVEWAALETQVELWMNGEDARGASTISMQVARNLFLWQGPSPARKALEVPLALWLDLAFGKRRMIEIYINVAELGPRRYGFEAASLAAFGISSSETNRRQAALLVATLPLPSRRDPASPTRRQIRLASALEPRARAIGDLALCARPVPADPPPQPRPRPDDLDG